MSSLWLGLVLSVVGAESAPRPNVILMVADDLGAMDLGCYGSTFHRTPHLDQLAKDGLRLTQAYSACPVCSPTRAALMTGKYPPRVGITDWLPGRPDRPDHRLVRPELKMELAHAEITLAEVLRDAGYATGFIGKWHLGGEGFGPLEQGFATNIAGDHTGTPLSYFAPFARSGRSMAGLEDAPKGEYLTDRLTTEAEKFLERNQQQPFFLYFPHYAPHTPIQAPDDRVAKFPQGEPYKGQQNNPVYAAMVGGVDDSVGRLRAKLKELGVADRTWFIFTSDNGGLATLEGKGTPATSNAPLREGKGWLYEGGIRIPLLVAGPKVHAPGRTNDVPVISHDLYATLAALCGATFAHAVDGVDLQPLLRQEGDLKPRSLFWHYPHYANQGSRPGGAIRQGSWKLIEFYETNRRELFHLGEDPREIRNRSVEQPQLVEELALKLESWRKDIGALMPQQNPEYRPNPPDQSGRIEMHARTALVTGTTLRYEPLPHKLTLGFWTHPEDTATFDFTVEKPGDYQVEALVGCGNGSGGSVVHFTVADQTLALTVPETGGFQAFRPQRLGTYQFAQPGRYTLTVAPQSKPGPAVMDLQQVTLVPVAP